MKCQRRILENRWHDFVRNSEVSSRTGLAPVSDRIIRGRKYAVPYSDMWQDCQSTLQHIRSTPDPSWKRPPSRPRTKWTDQLRRDNNNVPITTLWRQAFTVAVTRERLYGPSRLGVNDGDDGPCRSNRINTAEALATRIPCLLYLNSG